MSRPAIAIPRGQKILERPTLLRVAGTLLFGLAIGVGATFLALHLLSSHSGESAPPRATARSVKRSVMAQGTLEPRSGPVLIGSSLVGYQIHKVAVKEGDVVQQGQTLLELDAAAADEELKIAEAQKRDAAERQRSEIDVAQQRLDAANLTAQQAQDAMQLELESQRKRLDVAELKVKQAEKDLHRLKSLREGPDPIVSAQQVEQQEVLQELASAERDAAKVAMTRLQQSLDFQLQKARAEQKAAASSLELVQKGSALDALEGQISLAKLKLGQTKVTAPLGGTVIHVVVHAGEVVTTQPLLQIADLNDMICVAEVDVSDVPLLHENGEAIITSRAFRGQKLKGTIERIGNLAGSATLRPLDPRQAVDRTVTSVTLRIDAQEAMQALGGDGRDVGAALVGLQVDVKFSVSAAE
jgi:ABC exporter DevB family membrane fusion protein